MGPTTIRPLVLVHTEHLLIGRKDESSFYAEFPEIWGNFLKVKKKKFIYLLGCTGS